MVFMDIFIIVQPCPDPAVAEFRMGSINPVDMHLDIQGLPAGRHRPVIQAHPVESQEFRLFRNRKRRTFKIDQQTALGSAQLRG